MLPVVALVVLGTMSCDEEKDDLNELPKEDVEVSVPQVVTLDSVKGSLCVATLLARVSGLDGVAIDFELGIEYSTDQSFTDSCTIRQKAERRYNEGTYSITISGIQPGRKYYYRAYYVNNAQVYYGDVKTFTFEWDIEEIRMAVDLGLSVKWASINVGAIYAWDYGEYFAWGETEQKEDYSWSTYKYCNGTYNTQTKYNTQDDMGVVDMKTVLDLEDDAAHVNWGGIWRMPTHEELEELCNPDNCTWTRTTKNGVSGFLVTSKKKGFEGASIFLPAAGGKGDVNNAGNYWTSSISERRPDGAWNLYFGSRPNIGDGLDRCKGLTVRPVCPLDNDIVRIFIKLNKIESDLHIGVTETLTATVKNGSNVIDNPYVVWSSDNPSVATVNQHGTVTAVAVGTAIITATCNGKTASCTITVMAYEYVDLGLSVKWATINVGATYPWDYGDYFAWGETEPKTDYSWSSYRHCNGSSSAFTKYNTKSIFGTVDNKVTLDPEDDAAHVNWGGSWRMPTVAEVRELVHNNELTWVWTAQHGVTGYLITSNISGFEGASIFLPASGYRYNTSSYSVGVCGYYWLSSLDENRPDSSWIFDFSSDGYGAFGSYRDYGLTVRPVCP